MDDIPNRTRAFQLARDQAPPILDSAPPLPRWSKWVVDEQKSDGSRRIAIVEFDQEGDSRQAAGPMILLPGNGQAFR